MKRIGCTALVCMAVAVWSPWTWATVVVVLTAPILLGLWLVASLTDDRLRVLPHSEEPVSGASAPNRTT